MATRTVTIPVSRHQHLPPLPDQRQTTRDTEQSPNRAGIRMPRGARPRVAEAISSPGWGRLDGPAASVGRSV